MRIAASDTVAGAREALPSSDPNPACQGRYAEVFRSGSFEARHTRAKARINVMKVWIDQDLCTGDGLCEEIAPDVFTLLDDGLAYVKEGDKVFSNPGGAEGLANIPDGQLDAVVESAEECPGECIFIEAE
jgi:ferredoxin